MARPCRTFSSKGSTRGFTALEVLLATAILAFISISVSSAMMAGRQQTANARSTMYASFLAQQLMEELVRLDFPTGSYVLGPGAGETTRADYDNPDDYDGYTDGVGTSRPTIADLAGNAMPTEYQAFTRSVSFAAASYTPAGWGQRIDGYLVTVTVSKGGQTFAKLQQFVMP